jgi:hypothetical protein
VLKVVCASKEVSKLPIAHADKRKISSTPCRNCVQLESKLQVATNEISSLKLIIYLLSVENELSKQSHQVDFKADNMWSNVDYDILHGTNSSSQPKIVHSSDDASNHDQYAISTSNSYAALSTHPEHQFNDSSPTSHLVQPSRNFSRKNTNYSTKPHWKKSLPMTLN